MKNMELYDRVRSVPPEAQKTIKGGRLNGFTDINAMWRIQKLTEEFGPCGIGWKYTLDREWTESGANGEIAAFVDISLYYKLDGQWSEAIPGTGGSSFVSKETKGLYTSDECFKMALTDAISVAAKAIGMGADIYWEKGMTKYAAAKEFERVRPVLHCSDCGQRIKGAKRKDGTTLTESEIAKQTRAKFGRELCLDCAKGIESAGAK